MPKYYFTFGCGQLHKGGYHVIEAATSEEARKEMFRRFGQQWSMMYSSSEAAGVEEYHLHEVKCPEEIGIAQVAIPKGVMITCAPSIFHAIFVQGMKCEIVKIDDKFVLQEMQEACDKCGNSEIYWREGDTKLCKLCYEDLASDAAHLTEDLEEEEGEQDD